MSTLTTFEKKGSSMGSHWPSDVWVQPSLLCLWWILVSGPHRRETVASDLAGNCLLHEECSEYGNDWSRGWSEMVLIDLERGHFVSVYQEDSLRPYLMQSVLRLLVIVEIQHWESSKLLGGLKKISVVEYLQTGVSVTKHSLLCARAEANQKERGFYSSEVMAVICVTPWMVNYSVIKHSMNE